MPTFFRFLSEYFWLLFLCIGTFNYLKARRALPPEPNGQVGEAASYLNRFAIGANGPWLVMGVGQTLGFTPTVWYYFRPQDGNPFVIAWLVAIFLTTCTYAWWVLFAGGAEKVREFGLMAIFGQHTSKPESLRSIKLSAVLGVLIPPVWVYLALSMNAPLPK